jgi:hypothetical protein
MIRLRPRALACVCAALIAPVAVVAQDPNSPAPTPAASEGEAPDAASPAPAPASTETAAEDKRICRRVKLDMSSRRATKVCRTPEEWRDLNQPR